MNSKGSPKRFNQRPTLRDVAREAGVSIKTVSRVVNEEPTVSAATVARVVSTIARLGYRPNELARSLQGRKTRTIGLIIADISNPFYAGCVKAIEETARRQGYAVILCASDEDAETERAYVELLTQRRVDGLLLVPAADGHEYLKKEQEAGLPIVALDRPAGGLSTDVVVVQNRLGAREATRHLIQHGHRRIACIGVGEHLYTAGMRLRGYREALQEAELEEISNVEAHDIASAESAMKELLSISDRPTAVFTMNNLITVGVLQALDQAGLNVPQDMAIIGFDDFELAAVLHPRLTLVRQPAAELGERATELLLNQLAGHWPTEPQRIVLNTELMVRESCGCECTSDR